jgi:hypothetical protein
VNNEFPLRSEQTISVDRIRERVVQARDTRRAAIADRLRTAQQSDAARAGTHVAGDRVFDPVSGLEGEVLYAARENVVVPAPAQ